MGLFSSLPERLGRDISDFLRTIPNLENQKVNHIGVRSSASQRALEKWFCLLQSFKNEVSDACGQPPRLKSIALLPISSLTNH
jgi:hypothetical protein